MMSPFIVPACPMFWPASLTVLMDVMITSGMWSSDLDSMPLTPSRAGYACERAVLAHRSTGWTYGRNIFVPENATCWMQWLDTASDQKQWLFVRITCLIFPYFMSANSPHTGQIVITLQMKTCMFWDSRLYQRNNCICFFNQFTRCSIKLRPVLTPLTFAWRLLLHSISGAYSSFAEVSSYYL